MLSVTVNEKSLFTLIITYSPVATALTVLLYVPDNISALMGISELSGSTIHTIESPRSETSTV